MYHFEPICSLLMNNSGQIGEQIVHLRNVGCYLT